MGFRKTPKGNIIYDFDFTPKKLVPLKTEETGGPYDHYRVEGPNGEIAPIEFEYQGDRYGNYGFVYCSCKDNENNYLPCITTNAQLVSTLAKMLIRSSQEKDFDPWSCDTMAKHGVKIDIDTLDAANQYLLSNNIPHDNFALLRTY